MNSKEDLLRELQQERKAAEAAAMKKKLDDQRLLMEKNKSNTTTTTSITTADKSVINSLFFLQIESFICIFSYQKKVFHQQQLSNVVHLHHFPNIMMKCLLHMILNLI